MGWGQDYVQKVNYGPKNAESEQNFLLSNKAGVSLQDPEHQETCRRPFFSRKETDYY